MTEFDLFKNTLCPRVNKGIALARDLHQEAEECEENGDHEGHEEATYAYLSVVKALAIFCGVSKNEMEGAIIYGGNFRFNFEESEQ